MSYSVSRRQFLQGMGIVAAAAALSACSGGSSGSGSSNIYTEVSPGLLMRAPSDFAHKNSQLGLKFWFKNTGSSPVTLRTGNFVIDIPHANKKVEPVSIENNTLSAGEEKELTLYLNTDVDSVLTIYGSTIFNVNVTFKFEGKKAVYSGNVPALSPMTVTAD